MEVGWVGGWVEWVGGPGVGGPRSHSEFVLLENRRKIAINQY